MPGCGCSGLRPAEPRKHSAGQPVPCEHAAGHRLGPAPEDLGVQHAWLRLDGRELVRAVCEGPHAQNGQVELLRQLKHVRHLHTRGEVELTRVTCTLPPRTARQVSTACPWGHPKSCQLPSSAGGAPAAAYFLCWPFAACSSCSACRAAGGLGPSQEAQSPGTPGWAEAAGRLPACRTGCKSLPAGRGLAHQVQQSIQLAAEALQGPLGQPATPHAAAGASSPIVREWLAAQLQARASPLHERAAGTSPCCERRHAACCTAACTACWPAQTLVQAVMPQVKGAAPSVHDWCSPGRGCAHACALRAQVACAVVP